MAPRHRRSVSHIYIALLLALSSVAFLAACADSENETVPDEPAVALSPGEILRVCGERARAAGDAVQLDGWHPSQEKGRLGTTVAEVGDAFGVPFFVAFVLPEAIFENVTGESAWDNPAAREAYELEDASCEQELEYPEAFPSPLSSTLLQPEDAAIVECITEAVFGVESRLGSGSVGFTQAYRNYAKNRTPGSATPDYLAHRESYSAATGRSAYSDDEAMEQFLSLARLCPQ